MMSPLPSVEVVCAVIQQEESQKEVLSYGGVGESDVMAVFSKRVGDKILECASCGRKGHTRDKCWEVTGYPKWHYKHKPGVQKQAPEK